MPHSTQYLAIREPLIQNLLPLTAPTARLDPDGRGDLGYGVAQPATRGLGAPSHRRPLGRSVVRLPAVEARPGGAIRIENAVAHQTVSRQVAPFVSQEKLPC